MHLLTCHAGLADLKSALGQEDPEHPAPLFRLTSHQSSVVQRLLDKHGDDMQVLLRCSHAEDTVVLLAMPLTLYTQQRIQVQGECRF